MISGSEKKKTLPISESLFSALFWAIVGRLWWACMELVGGESSYETQKRLLLQM